MILFLWGAFLRISCFRMGGRRHYHCLPVQEGMEPGHPAVKPVEVQKPEALLLKVLVQYQQLLYGQENINLKKMKMLFV